MHVCLCVYVYLHVLLACVCVCGPLLVEIAASDKGARGTRVHVCVRLIAAEQQQNNNNNNSDNSNENEKKNIFICNLRKCQRRRRRYSLPAVQISLSKTVNKMYIYTYTCMYT